MLSAEEMADLKERCVYAAAHGFKIALAEQYAADLGYSAGDELPARAEEFSPEHLLHLMGSEVPAARPTKPARKPVKPPKRSKSQDNLPTVQVDPAEVQAAADAMKAKDEGEKKEDEGEKKSEDESEKKPDPES
jgi:hypothetical protein